MKNNFFSEIATLKVAIYRLPGHLARKTSDATTLVEIHLLYSGVKKECDLAAQKG